MVGVITASAQSQQRLDQSAKLIIGQWSLWKALYDSCAFVSVCPISYPEYDFLNAVTYYELTDLIAKSKHTRLKRTLFNQD